MTTTAPEVAGTVFDEELTPVARSYAEALLGAAAKGDEAEAVVNELEEFTRDVLRANPRFAAMLASSTVPAPEKDRFLNEAFGGRALPTVLKFLQVLNRHDRLGLVGPIAREARLLWDRKQNRRPATVRSAVELDDGQKDAIRDRVAKLTGASPILTYEVDSALIGGVVLQVGDDLYDASIKTKLDLMRRNLIAGLSRDRASQPPLID